MCIRDRVYRKKMEVPIEDMKRFLDGILHIHDEMCIRDRNIVTQNTPDIQVSGVFGLTERTYGDYPV